MDLLCMMKLVIQGIIITLLKKLVLIIVSKSRNQVKNFYNLKYKMVPHQI